MSDALEPDDTPVTPRHVRQFLEWYSSLIRIPRFTGNQEWWAKSMTGMTLGELRKGMRIVKRFDHRMVLDPMQFVGLCKGTANQLSLQRFNLLRQMVKEKGAAWERELKQKMTDGGRLKS
jgi:hypothetical protein